MAAAPRQIREHAQQKVRILDAARALLEKDGIEGISIRKITQVIGYSPTIVYHYFKDKDAVLFALAEEGFQVLMNAVRPEADHRVDSAEESFRGMLHRYMEAALGMPDIYRHVMLSSHPDLLTVTRVLIPGIAMERPAFASLCRLIERMRNPERDCMETRKSDKTALAQDSEILAQIIWSSTFGLLMRLLVEKTDEGEYRTVLMSAHLEAMTALVKGFRNAILIQ